MTRILRPLQDWKIRKKLFFSSLLLVLVPLMMVIGLGGIRFHQALKQTSEENLENLVSGLYALCRAEEKRMPAATWSPDERDRIYRILKETIGRIRVGESGYAYTIDSQGVLRIHPAKEGENIIQATDSNGFPYIRAMIAEAQRLGDGKIGTIRYPWMNPELGETQPRQKISKFVYFQPWDWIISAGAYEEEIFRSLRQTEKDLLGLLLFSLALAVALTLLLSNWLTRPILHLTKVTSAMAAGDLAQRVRIRGQDEIGLLGESFNRMASKVQEYTADLERLVEVRTRDLKESREKYRALSQFLSGILESTSQYAIMATDVQGTITEFNKGAETLFGWTKEEVVGKKDIGITFLAGMDMEKAFFQRISCEGMGDQEMERVRKDGSRFPAHSSLTVIADPAGGIEGFVEIVRNIADRKALEKELRETKDFLENIMESSVDGIVTTDLKGKITYLNRAMEEMLGYPKAELLGQHISKIYVRGIQEARDIMNLLWADGRVEHYEMEVRSKGGDILTILTSASMLEDEEGRVIGTSGIFKNITDQKRLEAKLKETQFYLVEASKMRALGELVAGVAHELNNPLMASQTMYQVIMDHLHEDCPNRERLEIIGRCNERIEKIINHLREFSRQTESDMQEIDIRQPIENALLLTGQQLLNHNITVRKQFSEDLPRIRGDASQLEQVFLNLISNARDALDNVEGVKELTLRTYLDAAEDPPMVVASVRDTGEGIPEEILDKVFEPFFSTKPVGKGTGLGLSLCFGIVEAHGGRLKIQSKVGVGTEVQVRLPALSLQPKGPTEGEEGKKE